MADEKAASEIAKQLEDQKEIDRKRFGTETTLQQILWDGQVEDSYFNDTMQEMILLMRKCCEDKEWKKQLYEININDYINEDD